MKKIILVRHGEALGNSTGELMGCRIGSNLTEKGKKQADMVADYLIKNYNIDNFYSSPVSRAMETSDIINYNGLKVKDKISEGIKLRFLELNF